MQKEDLVKIIWEVVDEFLIPKFNELNMNASGEWLGSLDVIEQSDNKVTLQGADYTKYLVNGRANGKRPPISVIEKWVNVKFGYYGEEAKKTAFAIANKIAKEGTTYYPNGTDLLEVLSSEACVSFIQDKIKSHLIEEVRIKIERTIKQTYGQ